VRYDTRSAPPTRHTTHALRHQGAVKFDKNTACLRKMLDVRVVDDYFHRHISSAVSFQDIVSGMDAPW
jgi:hypothetical protein